MVWCNVWIERKIIMGDDADSTEAGAGPVEDAWAMEGRSSAESIQICSGNHPYLFNKSFESDTKHTCGFTGEIYREFCNL